MSRHHDSLNRWTWAKIAKATIARAGGHCEIRTRGTCTDRNIQADHIVPLAEGGAPYDMRNTRAACQACNNARRRTVPAVDEGWTW